MTPAMGMLKALTFDDSFCNKTSELISIDRRNENLKKWTKPIDEKKVKEMGGLGEVVCRTVSDEL